MSDFFDRTLENLRNGPLGPVVGWIEARPRLSAWIFLGLGMVILVVIMAQDVGLQPGQWVAIIAATILVAGACVWIISWEDEDEEPEVKAEAVAAPAEEPAAAPARPAAKKSAARKSKKTSK